MDLPEVSERIAVVELVLELRGELRRAASEDAIVLARIRMCEFLV